MFNGTEKPVTVSSGIGCQVSAPDLARLHSHPTDPLPSQSYSAKTLQHQTRFLYTCSQHIMAASCQEELASQAPQITGIWVSGPLAAADEHRSMLKASNTCVMSEYSEPPQLHRAAGRAMELEAGIGNICQPMAYMAGSNHSQD